MPRRLSDRQRGFTLLEMIMVIVITGIISAIVAVFLRAPMDAYIGGNRRAVLADTADSAARFLARDVQGALANSVRVDGSGAFLELVPVRNAGRYRAEIGTDVNDDPLDFTNAADNSFDIIGPHITVPAGSSVVVYNLGIPGADVYESPLTVRRVATAGNNLAKITFTSTAASFPFESPGGHFQIVATPVSYACDLASGTLWRYSGYDFQATQPASLASLNALAGATRSVLAKQVTGCAFSYAAGALQRFGLVSILLAIGANGETVTLQQQVNVDNVP